MQGYKLSKEAQDDLKELKNYSRMTWGNKQTQEALSEIKNRLEKLIISPEFGKIRDEIIDGLRSFGVGRHILFYRLGKTEIEVARILHKRMDVTRHFNGF